jgi:phage terminase large subunit
VKAHEKECGHYPHGMALGFNPENPGHWLYNTFISGADIHTWPDGSLKGYSKAEWYPTGAARPFGSAEFIFARAKDNPFLSKTYIEDTLGSLPELLRKRYLEGQWLYVSGMSFFDVEAMTEYATRVTPPKLTGITEHEPKIRLRPRDGPWWVWKTPVRGLEPHRYIVGVDVASGTANDYSAVQIVDVEEFEQVAEFQSQIEPALLAVEVYRMATIYNEALVAPEITGGWGFTIVSELQRLKYPRLYTRPVFDRLNRKWTDALGWDTTSKSRAVMLDTLERVLREMEFCLHSPRCLTEMTSFVWPQVKHGDGPFRGIPQAQPGANDDLVMALAIAVTLASQRPRQLREPIRTDRVPELVTGY